MAKTSKPKKKDNNFENLFFSLCVSNHILPIPSLKVLSSPPKLGEKWKTYIFHEDPQLKYFDVYIQNENYLKDGPINKVIFRNHKVTDQILYCLEESINSFKTISTLKFYNCQFTDFEISILYNILHTFENITDLSLDRNSLGKSLYFILLKDNNLQYVSFQHCKIDENAIKDMSKELKNNKTLIFLDLSCNCICDTGLKYLSEAVRQNRSIVSLILIDNLISDDGVEHLTKALSSFPLNFDEITIRRQLIFKKELLKLELSKAKSKDSIGTASLKSKRKSKDKSSSSGAIQRVSQKSASKDSALKNTESNISNEYHPFVDDSVPDNGEIYCKGNYKIAYVNLAYNKITERGFKFIEDSIRYQINNFDGPIYGLIDLILTGNRVEIPAYYLEIQKLLEYKKKGESEFERKLSLRKSI